MNIKKILMITVCTAALVSMTAFAGGLGKSAITPTRAAIGPGGTAAQTSTASGSAASLASSGSEAAAVEITSAPESLTPAEAAATTQQITTNAGAQNEMLSLDTLSLPLTKLPEGTKVIVTVEGARNEDHGILRVYQRTEGNASTGASWNKVLETKAMLGMAGLYKEREGDRKTPVGIFRMQTPFGIAPREEGFPENYLQVDSRYYWNGDSDSPFYNKLVRTDVYDAFDKAASEHLIDYSGYYDYCLDSGYNIEGTPKRGSAIFLHCMVNGSNTHGCIAIAPSDMITVLRLYQEGGTTMMIYDRADPAAL